MAGYSPASARKSKSETLKSVKYLASPLEIYTCRGKKKMGIEPRISSLALKMIHRGYYFYHELKNFVFETDSCEDFGNLFLFPSSF